MSTKETGVATMPAIELAINTKKEELMQLATDYGKLTVTDETMEACDTARKLLKRKRTEIEDIVKDRKKMRLDWKRDEDEKDEKLANEFLSIISAPEKRLEAAINVLTEKRKAEVAAKIASEEKRKRDIKAKIQELENRVGTIRNLNSIVALEEIADDISMEMDSFEEYNEEGNQVIDMVLKTIENRKIVVTGEIEAAEAEAAAEARIAEHNAKEEAILEDIAQREADEQEKSREQVIDEHSARMDEETVLPEERYNTQPTYVNMPDSPSQPIIGKPVQIEVYRFSVQAHSFILPGSLSTSQASQIKASIEKILA